MKASSLLCHYLRPYPSAFFGLFALKLIPGVHNLKKLQSLKAIRGTSSCPISFALAIIFSSSSSSPFLTAFHARTSFFSIAQGGPSVWGISSPASRFAFFPLAFMLFTEQLERSGVYLNHACSHTPN